MSREVQQRKKIEIINVLGANTDYSKEDIENKASD